MSVEVAHKVSAAHLSRTAYLYVRQSTLRQVLENTESAARQYALRQRAIALGWAVDQIVVIDTDQGHSGASSANREGFQRLVAEVGMGRVGIVLSLEVSRLARNNADWHRLLVQCMCFHVFFSCEHRDGLPLMLAAWTPQASGGWGHSQRWTFRSPRGSRVGNFDEQVWGELRERGHSEGPTRHHPGGLHDRG